jgi:hypothetical protein
VDIETYHFLDKGLTAHIREDSDGSFWVCITNYESSDAVYESRGWSTVEKACEDALIIGSHPLPLTF